MMRCFLFSAGATPVDAEIGVWTEVRGDDHATLLVDLEAPSDAEYDLARSTFGLDERSIDVAQRADRDPIVRVYGDHFLATVLAIDVDESGSRPRIDVVELDVFVGRNFLLMVHERPLPFAERLQERTATNSQLGRFSAAYVLHALLDTLVTHYAREVDEVEDTVQHLEERLLRTADRAGPSEALVVKRHIQRLRRLVEPHRDVLGALVGADSPIDEESVENYLRDLALRLDRVVQRLDHARDVATASINLYISTISHRTNQQLRVLTFLSAVLLPITAVTGLFGTNFKLGAYDASEPFFTMLVGMAAITAGMLVFFRRRGWL
jgi:magnesium transporter